MAGPDPGPLNGNEGAIAMMIWSKEPAERTAGGYRPIRDYAIVGDCQGAALVARDGGVDWCCLRRFDAEPVFCRMLDADEGGFLDLRPEGPFRATREYQADTNILRTTFETSDGRVALIDFMPLCRTAEDDHVSLDAPGWFVRVAARDASNSLKLVSSSGPQDGCPAPPPPSRAHELSGADARNIGRPLISHASDRPGRRRGRGFSTME